MKYRSRMEIVAGILESAHDGAKITRIMYEAFISYPQFKDYAELLMNQGLLEYDREEKQYRTTKKGNWFLKTVSEMKELMPSLRLVPLHH